MVENQASLSVKALYEKFHHSLAGWKVIMRTEIVAAIINDRRTISPRRLTEPGPGKDQIEEMIKAACAAPDHRRLRPWRFILVNNEARGRLADLFEAAARETHGFLNETQVTRAREKAMNGPCLIAVVGVIRDDVPDVPEWEQWVSVGAAMQNILLIATSMGFGTAMLSGDKVATRALQEGLGVGTSETLLGFIAIGTSKSELNAIERPCSDDASSLWPIP